MNSILGDGQTSKSQATLTSARESLGWGKGSQKTMEKLINIVGLRRRSFFIPQSVKAQGRADASEMLGEMER